ncbi:MAG: hypothetical protein ACREOC_09930 [Gemmatimonadales bacterium]
MRSAVRRAAAARASPLQPAPRHRRAWLLILLLAWAVAVIYTGVLLDRHWVADDEGLLAQTAERVLAGEMPHRDFADVYTGGQSYFHAAAFWLAGSSLPVLRYALLLVFALWIPVVWSLASRLASPGAALAVTALAVVWSVPNYSAAMPSWYNLFLATVGLAAVVRFIDGRHRAWLVVAGLAGGLSFLFKVTGVFYVGAVVLYLVARAARDGGKEGDDRRRGLGVRFALGGAILAFVAGCAYLIAPVISPAHVYHFVLPTAALAAVAGAELLRSNGANAEAGARGLAVDLSLFLAGVAAPIVVFVLPYAVAGELATLLGAWFVAPASRYAHAVHPPMPVVVALPALLLVLLVVGFTARAARVRRAAGCVALAMPAVILTLGGPTWLYRFLWVGFAQSLPLIVAAGAGVLLGRAGQTGVSAVAWDRLFLALSVAALCSLVQIPFAAPIYFCYTAPLTFLAAAAIWHALGARRSRGLVALVAVYVLFAVAWTNGRGVNELGFAAPRPQQLVRLALPHAGLRVPRADAKLYEAIVNSLRRHSRSEFTFAAPDAPEIYFLSGLRNPTRALFEFTEGFEHDPVATLARLRSRGVTAVVINQDPKFSAPLSGALQSALAREYPRAALLGQFLVRWAE